MPAIIDKEKCEGCGDCVEVCPTSCIQMVDKLAVVKEDECIDCVACADECEQVAITMS